MMTHKVTNILLWLIRSHLFSLLRKRIISLKEMMVIGLQLVYRVLRLRQVPQALLRLQELRIELRPTPRIISNKPLLYKMPVWHIPYYNPHFIITICRVLLLQLLNLPLHIIKVAVWVLLQWIMPQLILILVVAGEDLKRKLLRPSSLYQSSGFSSTWRKARTQIWIIGVNSKFISLRTLLLYPNGIHFINN